MYVTNFNANTVSIIDTSKNSPIALIPVGSNPAGAAVTLDGLYLYVANNGGFPNGSANTVSVVGTARNDFPTRITVGESPYAIAMSPDGTRA